MKIEHSFEVRAPADTVFAALNDLELVVPCLPGARITGREGDVFHGELHVTFVRLHGSVEITHSDARGARAASAHGPPRRDHLRRGPRRRRGLTATADLAEVGGIAVFGRLVQDPLRPHCCGLRCPPDEQAPGGGMSDEAGRLRRARATSCR